MNFLKTATLALAAIAVAVPAGAVTIVYGGVAAPGGGYTSSLSGAGVTSETFNGTSGTCGTTTGITVSGNYQLVTGSQTGYYAAPAGDTTCYLSVPKTGSSGTATLDLSALLTPTTRVTSIGFYWGSMDSYNVTTFFNGASSVYSTDGSQTLAANGVPGDTTSASSNRYVTFNFSPYDVINKIQFTSNGIAFELDNLVVGVGKVPEPASLALFGGALLAGAVANRRRRKQA